MTGEVQLMRGVKVTSVRGSWEVVGATTHTVFGMRCHVHYLMVHERRWRVCELGHAVKCASGRKL